MSAALAVSEHEMAMAISPAYLMQQAKVRIDGGEEIDFARYPYLPKIIDDTPRKMTVVKGAQMGFTIAAILKALAKAKEGRIRGHKIRGIGYWFPTSGEANIFSKARFTPLMDQNGHVWDPRFIDVDSAELKRIGEVAIYLRGAGQRGGSVAKSTSGVKSIPLDMNILDERDEMDDSRVDAINHRLDSSANPTELIFSTPTLPEYGVDLEYQDSDQSSWLWKCTHCNEWVCMEDSPIEELIAEPVNQDPFYLCPKCRDPLIKEHGDWVARKPTITDHVGLWISQYCSPTRTAVDIVNEQEKAVRSGRHREFFNQVLARPYAEVEDQITESQLNELVLPDVVRPLRHEGPCAMGIDPGKPHWYEVRVRLSDSDSQQVARGRADTYEELSDIAKRFNVESGVIDQGADTSSVRDFVKSHPGFYGCLYVNAKKTDPDWQHHDQLVKVGRTWLLDATRNEIIAKRVHFYRKDDFWEEWVRQMTNLKRIVIENAETGQRDAKWVVTGGRKNDHLRHAGSYAHLALENVSLAHSVQRAARQVRNIQDQRGRKKRSPMRL